MSIVRSLLIRIGFQNDRQSSNQAERFVGNFKRKALVAASAITYAFGRVANYFSGFAERILDTNNFSKYIGIAIDDLYALQKAAQKVARIDEKEFQTALGNIQKMFNDLRIGASGELQQIADYTGIQLDRVNDNAQTIFLKFLGYLSSINDESERSKIAENLFRGVDAKKFADLAKNMDRFAASTKEFAESSNQISGQLDALKSYAEAVNELTIAWEEFTLEISKGVIPILQTLVKYLTLAAGFTRGVVTLDTGIIKNSLNAASGLLDPLFEYTGLNKISEFFKGLYGGNTLINSIDENTFGKIIDYTENKPGYQYQGFLNPAAGSMSPNITVNNDINVPPGTTEEQAEYMADRIQRTVENSLESVFRNIQYNNPVIE